MKIPIGIIEEQLEKAPFGVAGGVVQAQDALVAVWQLADYLAPMVPLFTAARKRATTTISVPRSADVVAATVLIGAAAASFARVQDIAQVRVEALPASQGGGSAVILDFGTPLTVSGVGLPSSPTPGTPITVMAYVWNGTQFSGSALASWDQPGSPPAGAKNHIFRGDVLTERLRLVLNMPVQDLNSLAAAMTVLLPSGPSDLQLSIGGGSPVWSHSGPIPRGEGTAPALGSWTEDGKTLVDITQALQKFAGDPDAPPVEDRPLEVVLTSRTPGLLTVEIENSKTQLRTLHRLKWDDLSERTLEFDSEGEESLSLPLPAPPLGRVWALQSLSAQLSGEVGALRALPPVGPEPTSPTELRAEWKIDADRAAAWRVAFASQLISLAGLKVPLLIGSGGAEARVVLYNGEDTSPATPLDLGAAEPLRLEATGDSWRWFTFSLPKPLALKASAPAPWAVLTVVRGEAIWPLSEVGGTKPDWSTSLSSSTLLRGAPAGPFSSLPAKPDALANARANYRALGEFLPSPTAAPVELSLRLGGSASPVARVKLTPQPRAIGVRLEVDPDSIASDSSASAGGGVALNFLTYSSATITLRDLIATLELV